MMSDWAFYAISLREGGSFDVIYSYVYPALCANGASVCIYSKLFLDAVKWLVGSSEGNETHALMRITALTCPSCVVVKQVQRRGLCCSPQCQPLFFSVWAVAVGTGHVRLFSADIG